MTTMALTLNMASTGFVIKTPAAAEVNPPALVVEEELSLPWYTLISQAALARVWDNDEDAIYDNWRELYGVPAR